METVEQIASADRPALVRRWESLFEHEPPAHVQIGLIRRVLAWQVQADVLGLSVADPVARPGGARAPVSLSPGTRLLREWQGATHEVLVLPKGFEHQGKTYSSLSAVARAITGTPWSGPVFFGIRR